MNNLKFLKNLYFLRNKYFWIFVAFFLVGVFLRAYHFQDWIHFELDQARDAIIIDKSLNEGPLSLPLLGPRAAGSFLRLGPAPYYLEYLGALFVGNSIVGSAGAILFFAILAMIAFYFFMRKYFSLNISLITGAIFATSVFLVTYSRFAWNPNFLPFFVIVFLLALLNSVDKENKKEQGLWLMLSATMFGILSQFHFLAMAIIFIVGVAFLLIKRPRIKLIFWVGSILIVLFLNLPLLINDLKSGGDNLGQLKNTVTDKSGGKSKYDIIEKTIKNYTESSLSYWTIITGSQTAELPRITTELKSAKPVSIECNYSCRKNLPKGLLAISFFTLGILILVFRLFLEKDTKKKDFLILTAVIFIISYGVFTLLAYDLSPRFYLIIIPLPFIFWGLIFNELTKFLKLKNLIWVFAIIFLAFNLYFSIIFLNQLSRASNHFFELGTDKILKQKTRITFEQQELIADYITKIYQQNKYAVFYHGQSEFHRAFAYLLDQRKIPRDGISTSAGATICKQGNYFLIIRTQSNKDSFKKYFDKFTVIEEKKFGTLTIFHLLPKDAIMNCIIPDKSKFRDDTESGPKKYTWKEVFNIE